VTPNALIAKAVQRERTKAGLSLSALANKAGLAKSTLSQLESGQGNPNIETLWAIAYALDVPFSYLFEVATPDISLIRVDEGELIDSSMTDLTAALLANCPPNAHRDLYRVNLKRGEARKSVPHPKGTVEHVIVIDGILEAGPEEKTEILNPGDYFRFPGDEPHLYGAKSDSTTFILVMQSRASE
jgi:transcriptional regulator with XRE-family HTH domain